MIISMRCFSCGMPISHLWDKYKELVKKYDNDIKNGKVIEINGEIIEASEYKALYDLNLYRECCRRMFITQYDMYDKIN